MKRETNVSVSVYISIAAEGSEQKLEKEKKVMKPEAEVPKTNQAAKPADFVKEPSTDRLKKKIEEWQNAFLVHGAVKP